MKFDLVKLFQLLNDFDEIGRSVLDSVKGTKNAFDISLIRKRRVFGIGDIAVFLVRNTRRLNSWTANKSAGNWAFKKFEIQSSILFKLFDPILGESQMIQCETTQKIRRRCILRKAKLLRISLLLILKVLKYD